MRIVWSLNLHAIHQVELLSILYGYSTLEILKMAIAEVCIEEMEQAKANDRPMEFGLDYFIGAAVPEPDMAISIGSALRLYRSDQEVVRLLLDRNPSLAVGLSILENQLRWACFWTHRSPTAEGRERSWAMWLALNASINRLGNRASARKGD
jgi:hypothetical protein